MKCVQAEPQDPTRAVSSASSHTRTTRSAIELNPLIHKSIDEETSNRLRRSMATTKHASGRTNSFYTYPARFHPDIARDTICAFSEDGDWILDPFMGGGTSVVEGLRLGRQVVGSDINSLARFIAHVRTRPLSIMDAVELRRWAQTVRARLTERDLSWVPRPNVVNLPSEAEGFFSGAIELSRPLVPRRRHFARAALLRLGQLTLDSQKFDAPCRDGLARRLLVVVDEMISTLHHWVLTCRETGIRKDAISGRRLLLHRTAVGLEEDPRLRHVVGKARLVITSPPYPGVHVLYHRWQYRGRLETPAPYWIANVEDGLGPTHYCGGSRTPTGLRNYFNLIVRAFTSIGRVMHPRGHVVQIIGFSDARTQLPLYLKAMECAGFRDVPSDIEGKHLERQVANRRWYTRLRENTDPFKEILLVHRLRT